MPMPANKPESSKVRELGSTKCFRCDGTGQVCSECGESEAFDCGCNAGYDDCEDCNGTGK